MYSLEYLLAQDLSFANGFIHVYTCLVDPICAATI